MTADLIDETSQAIGVPEGFPPLLVVIDPDMPPPSTGDVERVRRALHSAWSDTGIAFVQWPGSIHQLVDGRWRPVTAPPTAEPPASPPIGRPASVPASVWIAVAISLLVNVATLAAVLTR